MQSLREIAAKYDTDKRTRHAYIPWYGHVLEPLRQRAQNVLEIGIASGESLLMWHEYFSNALIHGMDNDSACCRFYGTGIKTFTCDQADARAQEARAHQFDTIFDLIIDDGSHRIEDQRNSCQTWLPWLNDDGIYVIEDVQGAWRDHERWLRQLPHAISFAFVSFRPSGAADDRLIVIRWG